MRLMLMLCGGFGLGAIVCAIQFILIRMGRFRRNPYLGLPGYARESDKKWTLAHAAAAPWIGRAGLVAALASAIAGIALLLGAEADASGLLSIVSGIVGACAAGFYLLGANGAAHQATKWL